MKSSMTPEQIALIQTAFAKIQPSSEKAAQVFYAALFARDLAVRDLFVVDMKEQGRKLMSMLEWIVDGLARLDTLVPELEDLGRRHANYGVCDEHYATLHDALLEMLAIMIDDEFTADTRVAWSEAYTLIARIMQSAAAEQSADIGLT